MSNFSFLDNYKDLTELRIYCEDAENFALSRPDLSAMSARKAVEFLVKYIYKAKGGDNYNNKSLFDLINTPEVQNFINDKLVIDSLNYIRILGNNAAHNKKVTQSESLLCLEDLYLFVSEVLISLGIIDFYPDFDDKTLPKETKEKVIDTENISADNPNVDKLLITSIKKQDKVEYQKVPEYLSEANTRKIYINTRLKESGWEIVGQDDVIVPSKAGTEIKVHGMPYNTSDIGYCDYVLFGRDAKPLAVVEAKRTTIDADSGRAQGELYCDCLEKQYGVRPILYYTNGCDYWIRDGFYPDRKVSGFHTLKELEYLIKQQNKGPIHDWQVNSDIVDRLYQTEAIKNIAERFDSKQRKALLVMATGTGKTRVAIEAVDVLLRNGWIKNVLFLADRTLLVKQASDAFNKFLPNQTTTILSEDAQPNKNARIMFSTYQTIIHYIDCDEKEFGIGRFDLIIVDEAHRSIFNKYKAIFTYFDSLLLGLTATPREDVDANTYDMFDCEGGEPNFDYSYDKAVGEGYIVPFEVSSKSTSILGAGINYDDLPDEEKKMYEDQELYIDYDKYVPPKEINEKVMNKPTIDLVLKYLMNYGLKVNDGNTLGKTIIFATSHRHAQLIVERFRALYPDKPSKYCQLIDYQTKNHVQLTKSFENDDDFRIAVSVDMLDTGVDILPILNLVFFKAVRSKIKFWQMIGRGTRLCSDLLGPGRDKKSFLIFDWCGNFPYFSVERDEHTDLDTLSLSQKIFNKRLEILRLLQSAKNQDIEYNKSYYNELKEQLISSVKHLKDYDYRILIRDNIVYVDKYCNEKLWVDINGDKENEIKKYISPLIEDESDEDVLILKFDLKMLTLEYEQLGGKTFGGDKPDRTVEQIKNTCRSLLKKATIPKIKQNVDDLRNLSSDSFWKNASLEQLETYRQLLRNLMIYLDKEDKRIFYTDFSDEVYDVEYAVNIKKLSIRTYKEKVEDYLLENGDNPVILKIKNIEKLDKYDFIELQDIFWNQLGSKEDYYSAYQDEDNLAVLVRSVVDLDNNAVNKEINRFIDKYNLNSKQIQFIRLIIDYVNKNGDIDTDNLVNDYPFVQYDLVTTFGDHINAVKDIVNHLHDVVKDTKEGNDVVN